MISRPFISETRPHNSAVSGNRESALFFYNVFLIQLLKGSRFECTNLLASHWNGLRSRILKCRIRDSPHLHSPSIFIFESLSLTLYFLMLLSKFKNYNSIEVVIKYFFIGAFSTFSLLFSVSFIYGHFGTSSFFFIKKLITLNFLNQLLMPSLLLISICILLLSFFLKLGIFPFNF